MGLDLPLPRGFRLQLGGGVTSGGVNMEDTASLLVGMDSDPGRDFVAGIRYRLREQENAFRIETAAADFTLFLREWMIFFAPRLRYITLYTSEPVRRRRGVGELELESQGMEFGAGYLGLANWGITVSYRFDDYSRDLSRMARHPRLAELLLSQGSLNLAWGLDRSQLRIDASYYFERLPLVLGVGAGRSSSAIDGSNYDTASLQARWDEGGSWGVELEGGSTRSEGGYRSLFLATIVSYRWW